MFNVPLKPVVLLGEYMVKFRTQVAKEIENTTSTGLEKVME